MMIVGPRKLSIASSQNVFKRLPSWRILQQSLFRTWKKMSGCNHMLAATDFSSGHVFFSARASSPQFPRMHSLELPQCRHHYFMLLYKDLSVSNSLARRHFITYFLRLASLLQFFLRRSILWIPFLFSYEITCFSFPYQLPEINKLYMEELKEARIPYKDSPELLLFLMEFSSTSRKSSSLFEQCKVSDYVIDNLVWL